MKKNLITLALSLFMGFMIPISAQNNTRNSELMRQYAKAEQIYGPDDLLIFGKQYLPEHYKAEGNPYLSGDRYVSGELFIQDRQFTVDNIKYNIENQAFILKTELNNNSEKIILLNPLRIDSAIYENRLFVHFRHLPYKTKQSGYYEKIGSGRYAMLIFHYKFFKTVKNITDSSAEGRYSDMYNNKLLIIKTQPIRVNNRRSFLQAFSKVERKQIRRFIRKNHIRYRKADSEQLHKLIQFCNEELSN